MTLISLHIQMLKQKRWYPVSNIRISIYTNSFVLSHFPWSSVLTWTVPFLPFLYHEHHHLPVLKSLHYKSKHAPPSWGFHQKCPCSACWKITQLQIYYVKKNPEKSHLLYSVQWKWYMHILISMFLLRASVSLQAPVGLMILRSFPFIWKTTCLSFTFFSFRLMDSYTFLYGLGKAWNLHHCNAGARLWKVTLKPS